MSNFALLLILTLFMSQQLIANAEPYHVHIQDEAKDYHVHIQNGLKDYILGAHCKSKDDDLGFQYIAINGEFQWKFRYNLFHTTLFFCSLSWIGGHRTFDAFLNDGAFFNNSCARYNCYWKAQVDGIYSFNSVKYELQYNWEH
jgi:hypothetical protein